MTMTVCAIELDKKLDIFVRYSRPISFAISKHFHAHTNTHIHTETCACWFSCDCKTEIHMPAEMDDWDTQNRVNKIWVGHDANKSLAKSFPKLSTQKFPKNSKPSGFARLGIFHKTPFNRDICYTLIVLLSWLMHIQVSRRGTVTLSKCNYTKSATHR